MSTAGNEVSRGLQNDRGGVLNSDGLTFLDRSSEGGVGLRNGYDVSEALVNFNPCRIEPFNEAFEGSRKPLLAGFIHKPTGRRYWIINVHQK